MDRSIVAIFLFFGLASFAEPSATAQDRTPTVDPAPKAEAKAQEKEKEPDKGQLDLRSTQVTLAIDKGRTRRQFRATVLARKDDVLTVLTAAHCLSDDDEGGAALLLVDGEVVEGTTLSVVRNPSYQPLGRGQIPGPDNAIARFRFQPANKFATEAFEAIRPAPPLASRQYPDPSGRFVAVRMFDKQGVEHLVKASNHTNPRLLVWGPSYKPSPGDSGGGVFVVREGADGQSEAHLIGVIVAYDGRGGNGSLVSREMRWLADAWPAE